jgi:hypothetical protein
MKLTFQGIIFQLYFFQVIIEGIYFTIMSNTKNVIFCRLCKVVGMLYVRYSKKVITFKGVQ